MERKDPVRSKTAEMKIGKMTYIVTTHFNENGRESAEDKLLQLVVERVGGAVRNREESVI